jgi:TonB family protein
VAPPAPAPPPPAVLPPSESAPVAGPPSTAAPPAELPRETSSTNRYERWRSSLEGYVPLITRDNQVPLGTAAPSFASYLAQMHKRVHPLFTERFLQSLDQRPASDPMNDANLYVTLEIVLEKTEGRVLYLGVVRPSGSEDFDVAALVSVYRAQPFGAPPSEIVSPDGNVYLHWEFHRGVEACGTANAHPYLLKSAPPADARRGSPPQSE